MNRLLLIAVLFVMVATNFIMDYIAFEQLMKINEQQIDVNEETYEFHTGVVELFEYLLPNTEHEKQEIYT